MPKVLIIFLKFLKGLKNIFNFFKMQNTLHLVNILFKNIFDFSKGF